MKADLADKDILEAKRAQHEEEVREKGKLISEQKAVRIFSHLLSARAYYFSGDAYITRVH